LNFLFLEEKSKKKVKKKNKKKMNNQTSSTSFSDDDFGNVAEAAASRYAIESRSLPSSSRPRSHRHRRSAKSGAGGSSSSSSFEDCVMQVKAKQTAACANSGYKINRSSGARRCYNPWAVCHAQLG
jgi:hypothetical protein